MTSLYATIAPHFTRQLLSPGLQVGYFDDGGVWQFLAPSLALRLPLRAIEWKNLVGVTQTIDRLPLHFVHEPSVVASGADTPLMCVYVIKCEDMERYKATVKAQISHWIDRMNAARVDWMLLYVPLGTRAKRGSVAASSAGSVSGAGTSSARHAASGGVYKKIFERIRTDFGNKKSFSLSGGGGSGGIAGASAGGGISADSSRTGGVTMSGLSNFGSSIAGSIGGGGGGNGVSVDRICKIDTLEGASVVGAQATNEMQWTELLLKMRKCIMEAFECKCLQYEEEARVLDAKRSLPSWDFGAFFVAKERLALMYQQTCLLDDAIRHLDELEAIFQFLIENDKRLQASSLTTRTALTSADAIFTVSPLAIDLGSLHNQIISGQASPLLMRLYFFTRQIRTLYLMGDFRQLIQRATSFISLFYTLLVEEQERSQGNLRWYQPHQWAAGACLEIAYACELSWSGHDYQISSASIPEGVSFALTPETMASVLGDILYLARRVLKKSARSNGWWTMARKESKEEDRVSTGDASPSWYCHLQSMFESASPNQFQRCVWELSHLSSLHFSRAGRHRFAVFLGAECAQYHFRHGEFESASRLFRSHARQCEEDKWWALVGDSVKRICDSDLSLGRSTQAVAACFSMLEIAQASQAVVSRDYLDRLLTTLVQSLDHSGDSNTDGAGSDSTSAVKMGKLIKPTMMIETMQSPESDLDYGDVRVTLSLANQFPAGIQIESVRIRFTSCENRGPEQSTEDIETMKEVDLSDPDTIKDEAAELPGSESLVELQEQNVYLYERASVNLVFLYGDVDVGFYVCSGLECTVAGNSFPLFSRQDLASIRFAIPPRESTLVLSVNGPPILTPLSMEEIHISIESEDDVVQHGVLEIAVPDTCDLVSISHARSHLGAQFHTSVEGAEQLTKKYSMEIQDVCQEKAVTYSVWVVVGDIPFSKDDVDDVNSSTLAVPLAVSLRYEVGTSERNRRTGLRRCERQFIVTRPLSDTVRLQRISASLVYTAISVTCNPVCGVRIANYALNCSSSKTGADEAEVTALEAPPPSGACVVQDPNGHLVGHHMLPNETVHMVFGVELDATSDACPDMANLRIGLEYDASTEAKTSQLWLTTSAIEIPLRSIHGAVYEIDVQPKTPPSQLAPAPFARGSALGEEVIFFVTVRRLDALPHVAEPLLLCVDDASARDWVLLGKQREAFRAPLDTAKRFAPLRVGRLRFPQFSLRAGGAPVAPQRVFCAQRAKSFLVV